MAQHQQASRGSHTRDLSHAQDERLRAPRGKNPAYSNEKNSSAIFCANEAAEASSDIKKKEDAALKVPLEIKLENLELKKQRFPARPEYVSGPVIKLRANYLEIRTNPAAKVYRYLVSVTDLPTNQNRKKRHIIQLLIDDYKLSATAGMLATDFSGLIVTRQKLGLAQQRGDMEREEFLVTYKNEGEAYSQPGARIYQVRLESDGVVSLADLQDYLGSPFTSGSYDKQAAITALNIILTWTPTRNPNIFSGARSTKFYPRINAEEVMLGAGLFAIKGYYASVRTSIARLLLNVNVCTSAFCLDGRVDLLIDMFDDHEAAAAFLTKRRISTDYLGGKHFKVIDGFTRDQQTEKFLGADQVYIKLQDGRNISVAEYFEKEHRNGRRLLKPNLPLILAGSSMVNGTKVPCWIPAEECRLVPGQPYGKKLSGQQTTKILEFAALPPAENARRIMTEGGRVLGLGNKWLEEFGVRVTNKMIVVEGRKLGEPQVCYSHPKKPLLATNGGWNIRGQKFIKTIAFPTWSYLKVTMPMEQQADRKPVTNETIKKFREVMGIQGFKIGPCIGKDGFAVNVNMAWEEIDNQLEKVLSSIAQCQVKALLVILDREDTYVYSRIKFLADLKYGIHTVHAVGTKMLKKGPVPAPQYIANLALKFNLKLGGINHYTNSESLGFLKDGNTMLVGIDVAHPSPGQIRGGPSIVAVVASVDKYLAQWPCSLRTQQRDYKGADEVVKPPLLSSMMLERLATWKSVNKSLPERILVYRDGVSESQYETVLDTEVPAIEKACATSGMKGTQIAFIVVGKRHHTRFFPVRKEESDIAYKGGKAHANPQPGTVVDRGITMESGWDFFLQAHDCLQGTARPAHYVVLRNDLTDQGLGAQELEKITHNLCYLFGRATRSISVCPPARYADLACERGKVYLYKYLTIRPDRSNENDIYDPKLAPWTRSVHEGDGEQPLIDSMFYI